MATTMSEALRECFEDLNGIRSGDEIRRWIWTHYRGRWAQGTLRDHLYGGRVNHPLAYRHHPGQRKFLFDLGGHRYELYDERKHGRFSNGRAVGAAKVPSWILIHSPNRYGADGWHDSPQSELAAEFRPNMHWHWKLARAMRDDVRPRTVLLAWDGCVFGGAIATITRKIGRNFKKDFNFAFVLKDYHPHRLIPLNQLRLGSRERNHRSLIRLKPENLEVYRALMGERQVPMIPINSIPESVLIESGIESGVNPRKGTRQGFGLTATEKICVERHAMSLAISHLTKLGFVAKDVGDQRPFDILATRNGKTLSIEVKGTTGKGAEISLTKNEVEFQRVTHPANMLIVVHSVSLRRGKNPKASKGTLTFESPWQIDDGRLTPISFSYRV